MLAGHDSWVVAMARAATGDLFTSDYIGHVICWSCESTRPRKKWSINAHQSSVRGLAVSQNGQWLATGDRDGKIRVWSTKDGKLQTEMSGHDGQVFAVAFHPNSERLVSADRAPRSPQLKQWNVETGEHIRDYDAADVSAYRRGENIEWGGVRAVAVSADGSRLACSGRHKYAGPCCVLCFDWHSAKQVTKLQSEMKGVFSAIAFHPSGRLVASAAGITQGEIVIWDWEQETPLASIATAGPCLGLDLHPDGRQVAVAQSVGKRSYPEHGALGIYGFEI